jgi:hypothetical protein
VTVSDAIRDLLLSFAPVRAIVGTRIYVLRLPQSPTLPAIRLQRIDANEELHLRGPSGIQVARVQVDSVSLSGTQAETLDAAVHGDGVTTGLRAWRGFVDGSPGSFEILVIRPAGVREGYDALELKQYKVMRDYMVTYRDE